MAKTGKLRVMAFYIECPHCCGVVDLGEMTDNGAWDVIIGVNDSDYQAGKTVPCMDCGVQVRLPKAWSRS